jgi:hypothetical protein
MSLKRLGITVLALALGSAVGTAQATDFSLIDGGGQLHIGGGLALPIQTAIPNYGPASPTKLPPLLVPIRTGAWPVVTGTLAKPLLTAPGKQGYQRKLVVPPGVLSKKAAQTTIGIKFSNLSLFAVGTNLTYKWPAVTATFSTGNAITTTSVSGFGGSMTYSNALGSRFGGAAQFALSPGSAAGNYAQAPVTLYLKINATTPACTNAHPLFGGTDPACAVGIMLAVPTGVAGIGGATPTTVKTPGSPATLPNVAIVKMGLTPLGTFLPGLAPPAATKPYPVRAASATLPTNMATSQPAPWTTGRIILTNALAVPTAETFTITGKDDRTVGGAGTIQMVSGALSSRAGSGPNANRGWVRLKLRAQAPLPSMSPVGLATTAGLMLLVAGYALRRRIFA